MRLRTFTISFSARPSSALTHPRGHDPRDIAGQAPQCGDTRGHTPPVQPVARAEGHEARQSRAAPKANRRVHGLQTKDPQATGSGFRDRGQPGSPRLRSANSALPAGSTPGSGFGAWHFSTHLEANTGAPAVQSLLGYKKWLEPLGG